jgi:hypothetical protein
MKPITDDGDPGVFALSRDSDGSWLRSDIAEPDRLWYPAYQWNPSYLIVFRVRK